jgi:hypothetical protein
VERRLEKLLGLSRLQLAFAVLDRHSPDLKVAARAAFQICQPLAIQRERHRNLLILALR